MPKSSLLVSLLAVLFASGCATLFRGTSQDLQVDSTPSGALATLSDGQSCTTPCTMRIGRGTAYNVKFAKEGCDTQVQLVSPHIAGSGVVEAVLLGGIIDFADGAVYDAEPNPLNSGLQCSLAGAAPVPRSPAMASDQPQINSKAVVPTAAVVPATAAVVPAAAVVNPAPAPVTPAPAAVNPAVGDQWKSTDHPE
jgi:hypothetical protein